MPAMVKMINLFMELVACKDGVNQMRMLISII
jgi:hypothetical protein